MRLRFPTDTKIGTLDPKLEVGYQIESQKRAFTLKIGEIVRHEHALTTQLLQ